MKVTLSNAADKSAGILSADSLRLTTTVLPSLAKIDLRGNPLGNSAFGYGTGTGVIDTVGQTLSVSGRKVPVQFDANANAPAFPTQVPSQIASAGVPLSIVYTGGIAPTKDTGETISLSVTSDNSNIRAYATYNSTTKDYTITAVPAATVKNVAFVGAATITVTASDRSSLFGAAGRVATQTFDVNVGTVGVEDRVAYDANSSGKVDTSDPGLEGRLITATLTESTGQTITTVSSSDGRFRFKGLTAYREYTIRPDIGASSVLSTGWNRLNRPFTEGASRSIYQPATGMPDGTQLCFNQLLYEDNAAGLYPKARLVRFDKQGNITSESNWLTMATPSGQVTTRITAMAVSGDWVYVKGQYTVKEGEWYSFFGRVNAVAPTEIKLLYSTQSPRPPYSGENLVDIGTVGDRVFLLRAASLIADTTSVLDTYDAITGAYISSAAVPFKSTSLTVSKEAGRVVAFLAQDAWYRTDSNYAICKMAFTSDWGTLDADSRFGVNGTALIAPTAGRTTIDIYDTAIDQLGRLMIAGATSNDSSVAGVLAGLDAASGQPQWPAVVLEDPAFDVKYQSITVDSGGSVFVYATIGDGTENAYGSVLRYDRDGVRNWQQKIGRVSSYWVYFPDISVDSYGNVTLLTYGPAGTGSAPRSELRGLAASAAYRFRVAAVSGEGQGAFATSASTSTPLAAAPTAPALAPVAIAGNGSARLSWKAPDANGAAISDYMIEYRAFGSDDIRKFTHAASAATTGVVQGLTNDVAYQFRISAINAKGTGTSSPWSAAITPSTRVPTAPTGSRATGNWGAASVSWDWMAGQRYLIDYSSDGGASWTAADGSWSGGNADIQGLTGGSSYIFRVSAVNQYGVGTASSPSQPVKILSAKPNKILYAPTAIAGNGQVALQWQLEPSIANGSVITDWYIEYSSDGGASFQAFRHVPSPQPSITVTGLKNGTRYVFQVSPINAIGTGWASDLSLAATPTDTVPAAPRNLAAVSSDGAVALSWAPPEVVGTSPVRDYVIEYSVDNGSKWTPYFTDRPESFITSFSTVASTGTFAAKQPVVATASSSGVVASGLGQTLSVNEGDSVGFLAYVQPAAGSLAPTAPPLPPTGLKASGKTSGLTLPPGTVKLEWDAFTGAPASATIADSIVEYKPSAAADWIRFDDGTSSATSATITGLTGGVEYSFRLKAVNSIGVSAVGSTVVATPTDSLPAAPTNVSATAGDGQATVQWQKPGVSGGGTISGYEIRWSTDGGSSWTPATTAAAVTGSSLSAAVTGLTNGLSYLFDIAAVTTAGTGARAVSQIATPRSAAAPGQPRNVTAGATANPGEVTVSWQPPASGLPVTTYLVEYKRSTDADWLTANSVAPTANGTGFAMTVSGLAADTSYQFRVRPVTVLGASGSAVESNSAKTLAGTVRPGVPTNLQVMLGTIVGEIWVSWSAPAIAGGTITDYTIQYSSNWTAPGGGTWTTFNDGVSANTWASITGLVSGTSYAVRVAAVTTAGTGGFAARSALVSAAVPWMQFVKVGDAGNAADTSPAGFGAVSYEYRIGTYEVTIGQYVDFLNAVAKTDTYGLYNPNMFISCSGASGSYSYTAMTPGGSNPVGADSATDRPITRVSWFDAARFANWLHNGRPNGAQGTGTTETGAYTLNGVTTGNAPAKNADARFSIPTENEWYKAAYYKGGGANAGYWDYATQSDARPGNSIGNAPNQANFYFNGRYSVSLNYWENRQNLLTNVGAFTGSRSSYGTFDQAGNVFEWNDLSGAAGSSRGARGGSWYSNDDNRVKNLSSSDTLSLETSRKDGAVGFRLASPILSSAAVVSSLFPSPTAVAASITGTSASLTWTAPTLSGSTIQSYVVESSSDGGATWTTVTSAVAREATSYSVTGLTPGAAYSFRVAAQSSAGVGAFSEATPRRAAALVSVAVPGAPASVTATATIGGVNLSWNLPATDGGLSITDYAVEYQPAGGAWTRAIEPASTTRSVSVTGLVPNTSYLFRVAAVNALGQGAWSTTSTGVTPTATKPAAPTLGTVTAGNGLATISWSAVTGGSTITGYSLQQSTDAGQTWATATTSAALATASSSTAGVINTSTGTATVTGLANGLAYSFRLAATNTVGTGDFSKASTPVTPVSAAVTTMQWDFGTGTYGSAVTSATPATTTYNLTTDDLKNGTRKEITARVKTTVGSTAAEDKVTIFVNAVAPTLTLPTGAQQQATEGSPTTIQLGSFTGPNGDGTAANGTQWQVDARWWKATDPRPLTMTSANAVSFTAARGAISRAITLPSYYKTEGGADGTYKVEVTVTDNDGQTAEKTFLVTVKPATPTAAIGRTVSGTFQPLSSPVTIKETETLVLDGKVTKPGFAAVSPQQYDWKVTKNGVAFPTGTDAAGARFTLRPDDGGTYVVTFRAKDENGTTTAPATVTVTVGNVAPTAGITIEAVGQDAIFDGKTVVQGTPLLLSVAASAAMPGDAIADGRAWTITRVGGGFSQTSVLAPFTFTPQTAGDYDITLAVADDDFAVSRLTGSATRRLTVTNAAPTIADGPLTGLPPSEIPEGTSVSLSVAASDFGDTLSYSWSVTKDGLPYALPGVDDKNALLAFTPDDNGDYVATVTVSDTLGATTTRSGSFTVTNVAPMAILLSKAPDASGATAVTAATAVNQGETLTFSVVGPNNTPSDGANDVSAADRSSLRYAFDLDDDGAWEVLDATQNSYSPAAFTDVGVHVIRWKVADKDGGEATGLGRFTVKDAAPAIDSFSDASSTVTPTPVAAAFATLGRMATPQLSAVAAAPAVTAKVTPTIRTTTGSITLSGTFSDKGASSDGYRGTATIRWLSGGTLPDSTVPLLVEPATAGKPGRFSLKYALPAAGNYSVTARIFDSHGQTAESVVNVENVVTAPIQITKPSQPTSVKATATPTTIMLSWASPADKGGDQIRIYQVDVATDSGFKNIVRTFSPTATSIDIPGLTVRTAYFFRVTASNLLYNSLPSTTASGMVLAPPSAPTGLTVPTAPGTATSVALTWTAPSDKGGGQIAAYSVQMATDPGFTKGVREFQPTTTAQTVTGLTANVPYYFRVRASNGPNWGSYSATAVRLVAPSAPTGLTVASGPGTATSVALSWTVPSDWGAGSITSYSVQVATDSAFTKLVKEYQPTTNAQTVTGLTANVPYYFRVRATNGGTVNWSSYSATAARLVPPSAPTAVKIDAVAAGSVRVSWTAPANNGGGPITGYFLQVSQTAGFTTFDPVWVTGTSKTLTGLTPKKTYFFRVMASDGVRMGALSAAVSKAV